MVLKEGDGVKKTSWMFKLIKGCIRLLYPKITVEGLENLPEEPAIFVGNHTQLHGPIVCELYFPCNRYTWCAGELMHAKEVHSYAYEDFWSRKPWFSRPFYKLLSYLITPVSVCLFNNAKTIGVYHDTRILSTFRHSVEALEAGESLVIFPEYDKKRSNILYDFRDKFIDTARFYYKKTGKEISFVPIYIAPRLKKLCIGKPIKFLNDKPIHEERSRICSALMEEIEKLALSLPCHTVVPYRNIPKRFYKKSIPFEVIHDEETKC